MAKKSWISHNSKVFYRVMEGKKVELSKRIHNVLRELANQVYTYIADTTYNRGGGNMPYYTGNMRDSTGLGVYYNGALSTFIPPRDAQVAQTYVEKDYDEIWGFDYIRSALSNAQDFNKGIWVVLYSTVPYAVKIETKGSKYWDKGWFSEGIVDKKLLPAFKTAFAKEFPNIAKQLK